MKRAENICDVCGRVANHSELWCYKNEVARMEVVHKAVSKFAVMAEEYSNAIAAMSNEFKKIGESMRGEEWKE